VLTIRLFGHARFELDEAAWPFRAPSKAIAVLGYLATHHDVPVSRNFLAELIWPAHAEANDVPAATRDRLLQIRSAPVLRLEQKDIRTSASLRPSRLRWSLQERFRRRPAVSRVSDYDKKVIARHVRRAERINGDASGPGRGSRRQRLYVRG